jgi:hypothetical protein
VDAVPAGELEGRQVREEEVQTGVLLVSVRRGRQPLNRPEEGGAFRNADRQQVIEDPQAVVAAKGAEMPILADGESEGLTRACVEG